MVFPSKNQTEQPLEEKKNWLLRKDDPIAYKQWQQLVTKKMPHLTRLATYVQKNNAITFRSGRGLYDSSAWLFQVARQGNLVLLSGLMSPRQRQYYW